MANPAQPRSWWSRNWKWVVPLGALSVVALCGGFFAAIFSIVFGMIKSSPPYEESLAMIQAHPEIREVIGTPIEPGFLVTGSIEVNPSSGFADIAYTVSGPRGSADVSVVAEKSGAQWTFESIDVEIDTGARFKLAP
jgi:hypothetical protein